MDALILVDIQNDFLPGGALAVPHGDEVIAVANQFSALFDWVVATQDWHPPTHASFAANHPGRSPGDRIDLAGLPQILWPTHCVQGTRGEAFAETLDTSHLQKVFQKGTDVEIDSYSGFFDNGRRRATGLGDHLKSKDVTDVYVLGLATDYCVKATALDARQLGFNVYLIEDGCRAVNLRPTDGFEALAEMQQAGVTLTRTKAILGERRGRADV